jgi:hypothetical protein
MKYAYLALIATAAAGTTEWKLTAAHPATCPKPTALIIAERKTAARFWKEAEKNPVYKA